MKSFSLLSLFCALALAAGCGKKQAAEETTEPVAEAPAEAPAAAPAAPTATAKAPRPPEPLPGASGVRNDLKNRNYNGAVEGLMALKNLASSAGGDAWHEYRQLNMDVGIALNAAAQKDPSAAQALTIYRMSQAR